jgi:ABC-type nickel/cobalt efflux system permease component RcnA
MNYGPELLLVAAVATVGVLHTMVPDHWVPIALIARQRGWSKSETARAALQAGIGHVLSTLFIAFIVWLAGAAFAQRFGHIVDMVSSLALIAFGSWFAISAWRDLRKHGGHGHSHSHDFPHLHGSEPGHDHDGHDHGKHDHDEHDYEMPPEDDPLYAPLRGETAVIIRHVHAHRHGRGSVHRHWRDHTPASSHGITAEVLSGAFIALVGLAFWICQFSKIKCRDLEHNDRTDNIRGFETELTASSGRRIYTLIRGSPKRGNGLSVMNWSVARKAGFLRRRAFLAFNF